MIKKIQSIDNFAVFKNFIWDENVLCQNKNPDSFKKINIIYGRNYSGKTTISRLFRSFETGRLPEKYESPIFKIECDDNTILDQNDINENNQNIRVFNEDFVRDNLKFLIDQNDHISSFAILGADNAEIEEKILALQQELGINEDESKTGLYKEKYDKEELVKKSNKEFEERENSLEDKLSKKATDRRNGIKYSPNKFGDQNYTIAKIKEDIRKINSESYLGLNEEKIQELENLINERPKNPIREIALPIIPLQEYINQTREIIGKKIGTTDKISELLYDFAMNEWVKNGIEINSKRERCAFCASAITEDRWQELLNHFDEESNEIEKEIKKNISEMEKTRESIKVSLRIDKNLFYSKFHSDLQEISNLFLEESNAIIENIDTLIDYLNEKNKDKTKTMSLEESDEELENFIKVFADYNDVIKLHNEYTQKLNEEQRKARESLRLHEVQAFCSMINYCLEIEEIDKLKKIKKECTEEYAECQSLIQMKESEISNLKNQMNDQAEGAKIVNSYLTDYFGHDFLKLEAVEVDGEEIKVRFEIIRDGKKAYNLSEGERSLIAFCYFMAKLEDIESSGKKLIIWIDDPISSLDGNHVFFIYSIIRAKIVDGDLYEQLFISTHNLNFLKYLRRITKNEYDPNVNYFIIKRQFNESSIEKMPIYLKKHVTEFIFLFQEIYICSNIENIDDANYMHFYNFPNNARKFLELLLFYYYPDNNNPTQKLEKFFGDDNIPYLLIDRINNEYSHLCGTIERGEMPVEVPEIHKVAKLIVDTIKAKHPEQYQSLVSCIDEDDS